MNVIAAKHEHGQEAGLLSLWYVVIAVIILVTLQDFFGGQHTQTLAYSEFKQALAAGKLKDVLLREGIATGRLEVDGLGGILRRLLDESRSRVAATLAVNRLALDALANLLLEKEVVDRRMLDELLRAPVAVAQAA